MSRSSGYGGPWYEPTSAIRVSGGIKAGGRGNDLGGAKWWAKKWMAALQMLMDSGRLSRGRSYARNGQVMGVEFAGYGVSAKVQGSRPQPYRVEISLKQHSQAQWDEIVEELSDRADHMGSLLAGQMPPDIEDVFRGQHLDLFPGTSSELKSSCSCPDWANPCKHVAAVYALLGEEFDRDPFLLFELRGMTKEKFLAALGTASGSETGSSATWSLVPALAMEKYDASQPLPSDPTLFWTGEGATGDAGLELDVVRSTDMLKVLGSFPFWRGERDLTKALDSAYKKARQAGSEVLLAAGGKG